MLRYALRIFRNLALNRYRYPNATIHPTAKVSSNSTLGNGVRIMSGAHVANSSLGEGTIIGSNCNLDNVTSENNVALYNGGNLSDCLIGRYSYATRATISMTTIGRFCSIGPDLICGWGDHPTDFVSTSPAFFSTRNQCGTSFSEKDFFDEKKYIYIGHDVWIGARVFIRDGVKIGNGAIVAAGAVVVKDVPDYAIVGGVPAKIIKFRFPDEIKSKLLELQWWDWPEDKLRQAQPYFAQSNTQDLIDFANKMK